MRHRKRSRTFDGVLNINSVKIKTQRKYLFRENSVIFHRFRFPDLWNLSAGNDAKEGSAPDTLSDTLRFPVFLRDFRSDLTSLAVLYFHSLRKSFIMSLCVHSYPDGYLRIREAVSLLNRPVSGHLIRIRRRGVVTMKTIIVTGCGGQLGIAVNRLLGEEEGYHLVNTDVAPSGFVHVDENLDITNVDAVVSFVREVKPYAIINCAAYTAVDAAESHLDLNYKINAIGPRNLAIAASDAGAKLVHISTDYVFPGTSEKPLTEFDPVGPKSVYGITKLAGENFVRDFAENYYILRTAWLYGEGKNFVRTMLRLSETHDQVTVVDDQFGSPTSTAELAKAIAVLLPTDNYGLFHATCEGSTSWDAFTREIYRLAGRSTQVISVSTEEYQARNPQAAPRPHYSILDNYMLRLTTEHTFADWHDALAVYLKENGVAV